MTTRSLVHDGNDEADDDDDYIRIYRHSLTLQYLTTQHWEEIVRIVRERT